jgi:hypothetical protein
VLFSETNNVELLEKIKAVNPMIFPSKVPIETLDPEEDCDYRDLLNEIIFKSEIDICKQIFIFAVENFDTKGNLVSRIGIPSF